MTINVKLIGGPCDGITWLERPGESIHVPTVNRRLAIYVRNFCAHEKEAVYEFRGYTDEKEPA